MVNIKILELKNALKYKLYTKQYFFFFYCALSSLAGKLKSVGVNVEDEKAQLVPILQL